MTTPRIESLNVGPIRTIDLEDERLTTAIWKFPGAGDEIRVISRPEHEVTMRTMVLALREQAHARSLRDVAHLPRFWRELASRKLNER